MPNVRMQNTVGRNQRLKGNKYRSARPRRIALKNDSYLDRLNNLFPFKINPGEYNLILIVLIYLLRLVTFILFSAYFIISCLFELVSNLCKNSIIARRVFIVIAILLIVLTIDFILNFGKVYPGVHVGNIDIGCKTIAEVQEILEDNMLSRLNSNEAIIYANDKSKEYGQNYEGVIINEQIGTGGNRDSINFWKTNSVELDANFPIDDIVDKALNETRGLNNIFKRLGALFFGCTIDPYAEYNQDALYSLINKINDTVGSPIVNPTCVINEGYAQAKDGSNGYLLNNKEFINQLNHAMFSQNHDDANFVINLYDTPKNISFETAEKMSNIINSKLSRKLTFEYKDNKWQPDRSIIGSWINVSVEKDQFEDIGGCSSYSNEDSRYYLSAFVDTDLASSDIIVNTNVSNVNTLDCSLSFHNEDGAIKVKTSGNFEVPNVKEACVDLNDSLFRDAKIYNDNKLNPINETDSSNVNISISPTNVSSELGLNEAMNIGLVQKISTYTTSYTTGAGTENRNKNISLSASVINNTICPAGGSWSFLDIVGDTTADKGYTEAGTVLGNRYSKSYGGGVCQVATTVFNAIYDSGFEILERYNHSLYISSYPPGRDAAIAYPDLDLKWQNDTNSDVLVLAESTGYSITVSLIGIDPCYTVKTDTGNWSEGDKYTQEYVVDPGKEPNSKFTQTQGTDGKSIVVKRSVFRKDGSLLRQREFRSNYKPKNEIIVLGPGDEANALLSQKNARMKDETDNW